MISEPLKLFLGLLVAATSALGYGLLVARFTKSSQNLAGDGVIGIAILTSIFMTEHFFVPLRPPWNVSALIPGVICFAFFIRPRLLVELLVIAAMLWWAVEFSRTGSVAYDHNLYHLQSAIWNTLDRAIPGIANLHTRLGFNSSVLVLGSGLKIDSLGGWSLSFLATAVIEAMIAADLLLSIRTGEKLVRIYAIVASAFLLLEPQWLLSPSYLNVDQLIAVGVLYSVLLFLDQRASSLLMCVPFLITVKLAAAPLVLLLDYRRPFKRYRAATILGTFFLFVWVARNVVLSGHLIFPVAATRLPVEWAVPKVWTKETAAWITSWAREIGKRPGQTAGIGWIKPWLLRTREDGRVIAAAWMAGAGLFVLLAKKALPSVNPRLIVTLACSLLFWFFAAPDVRFGMGFMFAAGCLLLAYAADSMELLQLEAGNSRMVAALLAGAMSLSAPWHASPDWPVSTVGAMRLARTPTNNWIWTPAVADQCGSVMPCSPDPQKIEYYPKRALLAAPMFRSPTQ